MTFTEKEPDKVSDALLTKVAELRGIPGMTQVKMAEQLGVSERQIRRAVVALRSEGKLLKSEIPLDAQARSVALEREISTFDAANRMIRKTEAMIDQLESEMKREVRCKNCGALVQKLSDDPHIYNAYFKGRETATKQLEYLSKLKGEWLDTPQLSILQIDADYEMILRQFGKLTQHGEEIAQELAREYPELREVLGETRYKAMLDSVRLIGPQLGQELFNMTVAQDQRRRKRFREYDEIVAAVEETGGTLVDAARLEAEDAEEGSFREIPQLPSPKATVLEIPDDDDFTL